MMSVSGFLLLMLAASLCPGDCRFIGDDTLFTQDTVMLDICSECSHIMQFSTNMIPGRDAKESVYAALHILCQRFQGAQASDCESQVKMYLLIVLQHTAGHLKPKEACVAFGLCAAHSNEELPKPSHHAIDAVASSSTRGTNAHTHIQEQLNPVCALCVMVIRKLETLLPKNMTEDALKKLMAEVCDLLPHSYKDECDIFVDKYGAEIIEFLLSSAAPHSICSLLHLCLFSETPAEAMFSPSDCESCRTLAVLSRLHLGLNSTELQTSSFLQSVCVLHPNAIPKCKMFNQVHGAKLQKVLGNQLDAPDVCERANLCISTKTLQPQGRNLCTLGPIYWCKDMKTAQNCGKQAFCEKILWKTSE
ncbi:surfactant protein Bb isoform X1 [Thalassophryne amazonica]|uniref:surfactant protein Bb isoform X1 n=1 Tax=Thalassophryne amazonica TaxID=390379 RepID=UPI0014711E05|nr:surfactant protein Bb isoform X1 [Thalassophryne amazonica]